MSGNELLEELRHHIVNGETAESATAKALDAFGFSETHTQLVWYFVEREARHIESRRNNKRLSQIIQTNRQDRSVKAVSKTIDTLFIKDPNGGRILLQDLTRPVLAKMIAQVRKNMIGLGERLAVLESALELLTSNPQANRVGDISDWESKLPKLASERLGRDCDMHQVSQAIDQP